MKKDKVINIRTNQKEKEKVDSILEGLGLNFSIVVNIMMKQIILTKGVPFPIVMPLEDEDSEDDSGQKLEDSNGKDEPAYDTRDYLDETVPEDSEETVVDEYLSEDREEILIDESPSDVDIEDVVLGVPESETENVSGYEEISSEEKPQTIDISNDTKRRVDTGEFENIFDAFQSMNILKD